jgi:hypothetical protein
MTLADTINQMILKIVESLEITSANPTHTNTVIQANEMDTPDIESMINDSLKESGDAGALGELKSKFNKLEDSPLGEIGNMTSAQTANFKSLLNNPSQFIMGTFMRKFAKGAGVVALIAIIGEAVKTIVLELFKPGRMFDIRFKRDIRNEVVAFQSRQDQQNVKQGFSSVIITSMAGQRGSYNQAMQSTNSLDLTRTGQVPANYGFNPLSMPSQGMELKSAYSQANNFYRLPPSAY